MGNLVANKSLAQIGTAPVLFKKHLRVRPEKFKANGATLKTRFEKALISFSFLQS